MSAAKTLREALEAVRDRFFPANQPEADRDLMWDVVNGALTDQAQADAPHMLALQEWLAKTEFVQTMQSEGRLPIGYLGWHRADVLKAEIERLTAELAEARAAIAAQAQAEPEALGALAKRNVFDAIRGAYDTGYNDARNARAVPGDSAPGYEGRSIEADHGGTLIHQLERLMQPAAQPVAVPDWQPIETAPKDGTAFLVMRDIWPGTDSGRAKECNGHNTYVAAWWASEGTDRRGRWVCYMDAVFDPTCPIEPTHWMPLPLPPCTRLTEPSQQPVAIQGYKCVSSSGAVLFTEDKDAAREMQRQGWTVIELSEAKPVAVPDVNAAAQALGMALAKEHAVYLTMESARKLVREVLADAPKD